MVADGQQAPLPLIFAGETQESAGGNERRRKGRNVHYFSAASHDRFLARRRQTKIPPRKPRTDLGFRQSASSGEKILPYPKVHFWSNTSWLCSACPARQPGFLESPLDLESVLPKSMCREASQNMSLVCVTSNSWTLTNWLLPLPKSCDWAPDPNWTFFQPFLGASSL